MVKLIGIVAKQAPDECPPAPMKGKIQVYDDDNEAWKFEDKVEKDKSLFKGRLF